MVLKYTPNGTPYREPPYSREEDAAFYKRLSNIQSLTVVAARPEERKSQMLQVDKPKRQPRTRKKG